jgi:hypothetical protein
MKSFKEYIVEVTYKEPDTNRLAYEEHDEAKVQSAAIKDGHMSDVHPAIQKAIHSFAESKPKFKAAMNKSKIQPIHKGANITNTEIGMGSGSVENKTKVDRVKKQIGKSSIDRPIVLRHKDPETGEIHHHLLAGNTRATTVGYGVQAHHIDV